MPTSSQQPEETLATLRQKALTKRNECIQIETLFNESTDMSQLSSLETQLRIVEAEYNKLVLQIKAKEANERLAPVSASLPASSLGSQSLAVGPPSRNNSNTVSLTSGITGTPPTATASPSGTPVVAQDLDTSGSPDWSVFMSYCWKNSKSAYELGQIGSNDACGSCDPRDLARQLTAAGFPCWLDVDRLEGGERLYEHLVGAIKPSKFAVICVSSEYDASENCTDEFKFIRKIKIPKIIVVVGPKREDHDWSTTVVGFMASDSLYIDTQGPATESISPDAFSKIVSAVRRGIHNFQIHGYQSTANLHSLFRGNQQQPPQQQRTFGNSLDLQDVAGVEPFQQQQPPPPPGSRWLP